MATFMVSSTSCSICTVRDAYPSNQFTNQATSLHFRSKNTENARICSFNGFKRQNYNGMRKLKSVEVDSVVGEEDKGVQTSEEQEQQQQETVSVPVSPSDKLTMHFQADGVLSEMAVPNVTKALEGSEGVSNLKVQVSEGIASIELKKQTTVQATGVASGLVEIIQGAGFKLQTLNLSFDEEEEVLV